MPTDTRQESVCGCAVSDKPPSRTDQTDPRGRTPAEAHHAVASRADANLLDIPTRAPNCADSAAPASGHRPPQEPGYFCVARPAKSLTTANDPAPLKMAGSMAESQLTLESKRWDKNASHQRQGEPPLTARLENGHNERIDGPLPVVYWSPPAQPEQGPVLQHQCVD